jgi:ferrochelatase
MTLNAAPERGLLDETAHDYDALIVVSFGGPEGPDDVIPFMENVLAGKNIPRARIEEVSEHYHLFGGVSPINAQNRALIAALEEEFRAHNLDLPIYWGNRNWKPYLTDTLRQMRDDGVKRALAFFTSAYSSYSGCRQYREDIAAARAEIGEDAPEIDKLRVFFNHPGFIDPNVENLQAAFGQIPAERRDAAPLVFVTHSLPLAMAERSAYQRQHQETCQLVAEGVGRGDNWMLVYQSRSGPPHQPWLEPDICDYLEDLKAQQPDLQDVVLMPIGFISDHMEVIYDLDTEAQQTAEELGLNLVRVATVGTHPQFISMIRELAQERMTFSPERRALGNMGPSHDICGKMCCLQR